MSDTPTDGRPLLPLAASTAPEPMRTDSCGCGSGTFGASETSEAATGCECATEHGSCACGSPTGPLADASVGRARRSDAPAVGLVQAAVWADAFTDVLEPEVLAACTGPAFASAWRASLATPPARHALLVARAGVQVVGFVAFGPSDDEDANDATAELLVLGVHPDARRVGHGSRLLNAAVDTARDLGFTWLNAWVPIPAEPARALLVGAGLASDRARRERVVGADGRTLLEVRLGAGLAADPLA